MSEPLIIYHGGECRDGFCSAWLFKQAFPNAEFHAANYGEPAPNVAGRTVYIVDFSYKRDVMVEILKAAGTLVVLDHHKTAEVELAGLANEWDHKAIIRFDMTKSGARLAWEYLCETRLITLRVGWEEQRTGYTAFNPPWLTLYTEDRDLWKFELDKSKEINATIRSHPLDFKVWDELHQFGLSVGLGGLVTEGRAILRAERQIIDIHVRNATVQLVAGHDVPCVNATVLFSEIAGELARGNKFGACYFDRADGQRQYSLRSDENGLDVSEIAKSMGGGGHKHAAGFQVESF